MFKRICFALCILLASAIARADGNEADIKKAIEAWLGGHMTVTSVRKADFLGLYEVVVGGDVIYTNDKATYVILGNVIDVKAGRNLTQDRVQKLSRIKFRDLPLDLAIKQVKGNGKRQLATFEDPNCTYCRQLAQELQQITDVTVYTFLIPILSPDSADKAKAIWCSSDRAKAWNAFMLNGTAPAPGKCDTSGLEKVMALANQLHVRGTPALFLADGTRLPGLVPAAELDEAMTRAGSGR
jgi:thiol:disulfide interchange protein DsbC